MKSINNMVFLNKIKERIDQGDFDTYFTIPFMTRELLFSTIKTRIDRKLNTGGTPLLSDNEVKDCLNEVKETASNIFSTYYELGFINITENGVELTDEGKLAIKMSFKNVLG